MRAFQEPDLGVVMTDITHKKGLKKNKSKSVNKKIVTANTNNIKKDDKPCTSMQ
jgi:hypothetical protein